MEFLVDFSVFGDEGNEDIIQTVEICAPRHRDPGEPLSRGRKYVTQIIGCLVFCLAWLLPFF
jgi:hypothetical protein